MKKKQRSSAPTVIILDDFSPELAAAELRDKGKLSWLFGGKPLANHLLEELAQIGVDTCFILTNSNAVQLFSSIMSVYRWYNRMEIEVVNYTPDREAILQTFGALANPNGLLLIEGDKIRGRIIKGFLEKASLVEGECVQAKCSNEDLGLTLLKPNASKTPVVEYLDIKDAAYQTLNTCEAFSRANFKLLSGELPGLYPRIAPGARPELWRHNRSSVHKTTTLENEIFIERGGRVERSCNLRRVLLNSDAFVSRGSELTNVIVMPDGFVPKNTSISNAIVSGDQVIHF